MPWKVTDKAGARRAFLEAYWERKWTVTEACRHFGISRQCAYECIARAKESGVRRLSDRSHRTKAAEVLRQRWFARVVAMRRKHSFAGPQQLRWFLEHRYPLGPWPAPRTIGRWLHAAGLTRQRRRRAQPGPVVVLVRRRAVLANDVWTVDFKGWFNTADGRRVCPLTVRDMATKCVLWVRHMPRTTLRDLRRVFTRLFQRYGLPRAIRTDNGPPFGGEGPLGWSTLSVWWAQLGIEVEHGRPACPQDNAEHEQMHQVLQTQTANPAAPTLQAQQRRFDRWRTLYNCMRPHRALGMYPPISFYQPSDRRAKPQQWTYPADCEIKRTDPRGRIRWRNRARLIGQAFGRQLIALKAISPECVAVYFGPHLLGELHAHDDTAIRAVRSRYRSKRGG